MPPSHEPTKLTSSLSKSPFPHTVRLIQGKCTKLHINPTHRCRSINHPLEPPPPHNHQKARPSPRGRKLYHHQTLRKGPSLNPIPHLHPPPPHRPSPRYNPGPTRRCPRRTIYSPEPTRPTHRFHGRDGNRSSPSFSSRTAIGSYYRRIGRQDGGVGL